MRKIKVIALFKIKEGKLNEFKQGVPGLINAVKKNEPGALTYDWYLNEEAMECMVLETYADSQALMAHAGNVGELLQKLMGISDLTLEVFGNPEAELKKILKDMGAKLYPFFAGL